MISEDALLIGIDLGGTNVRAGAVNNKGEVLAWADAPIEARRGAQVGLEKITRLVESVSRQVQGYRLAAIGIGSTGPIDRDLGAIQNPYTLPTWENVDIVHPLSERFQVPVELENDADAAALGEAWVGAGRGYPRLAVLTIGTGVGYALIVDGKVYRGINGVHPEGGHMVIDPHGPECYCGARGCLEMLAAGPAIARLAQEKAVGQQTLMWELAGGKLDQIDGRVLVKAARSGDALAGQVVDQLAEYLGLGIVNVLMLCLPDCVLMGGGVMEAFDVFEPGIRKVVNRHNVVIPSTRVKIDKMQLKGQAGVIGAARAAYNLFA